MKRFAPSRRTLLAGAAGALAAGAGALALGDRRLTSQVEARHPPRGAFVTAEGLRLHHVSLGPEDGETVILLHGATGNLNDMTFDLAPRLASAGRRVIAFDRPGLGWSQRPPAAQDPWRPATQARILRAAARALGVRRAVVLGHSWGAGVALAWALLAPEEVSGVVVLGGACMPWDDGEDGLLTPVIASRPAAVLGAAWLRHVSLADGGASAAARIFRPQDPPEGYLDHLQGELLLRPSSLQANTEDIQKLDRALADQARAYAGLVPPVRILHGLADTITSPAIHSQGLAAVAPRATLSLLPGIGHMLHHAVPETAAAAALDVA
ncbi:MAG: alpha/beta fold hydrolase [Pseudomonadota bacterium]